MTASVPPGRFAPRGRALVMILPVKPQFFDDLSAWGAELEDIEADPDLEPDCDREPEDYAGGASRIREPKLYMGSMP